MIELFGIKNCNTVKKALDWLVLNKIDFNFIDVKKDLSFELLNQWFQNLPSGLNPLMFVNQRGITWRNLADSDKQLINSNKGIIKLILQKPSVMKRPVLIINKNVVLLGYDEEKLQKCINMTKTLEIAKRLIEIDSITPNDNGCINIIKSELKNLNFEYQRIDSNGVSNLYAKKENQTPLLFLQAMLMSFLQDL